MRRRCLTLCLTILILGLLPLPAYAQRQRIFDVTVMANITVHRRPRADSRVVGFLEPGMPAWVFDCRQDCAWLDIGPDVWIQSSGVTASSPLPAGYSLPTPAETSVPPTLVQPPVEQPIPTATFEPTPTPAPTPAPTEEASTSTLALVVNIVDGDTIDVLINGVTYRVRYIFRYA